MHQRIGQLLHHPLVQLRVFAAQHQLDLLVQLARDFAHRAGQLRVDLSDGHQPHLHDRLLHLVELAVDRAGDLLELVGSDTPRLAARRARMRFQPRLLDQQLTDDVHHGIELGDVDSHGRGDRPQRYFLLRRFRRWQWLPQRDHVGFRRQRGHRLLIEVGPAQEAKGDAIAAVVDGRQCRDHFAHLA